MTTLVIKRKLKSQYKNKDIVIIYKLIKLNGQIISQCYDKILNVEE